MLAENSASRPPLIRHISSPEWRSLSRHHRRTPSIGRAPIRETLDASLSYIDDDEEGGSSMQINQYKLKKEIGRGSFGAVHLAVDQFGTKYAVKEFSKSRLRKRSQSVILRRPFAARQGGFLNARGHGRSASEIQREMEGGNPLHLIREEIAILKKLDHPNVVNLVEVLDDPEGDSLYMVLEMCEKGVVMKVDLQTTCEPYPEEQCRLWFRDMILGIEYLHAQGIVHRDIKPDNLLLTEDDVLKIADFGVSEIFEKNTPMVTAKVAGSPAFLPPELCIVGHGDVSGAAADIWSMGVTLYCLLFGCLPFNHRGVLELYEGIKNDAVKLPDTVDSRLVDLLNRLLEKDPTRRIKMSELRNHPWVTASGEDLLLPAKENTAGFIHPTEEEMNAAITKSIHNVMAVVRVANKFKRLALDRYKTPSNPPNTAEHVGDHLSVEHPPRSHSWNVDDRGHYQQDLNVSGINTEISLQELPHTIPADTESLADSAGLKFDQSISRQELEASCPSIDVQMVDPLIPTADPYQPPYLRIGAHMPGQTPHSAPHVCESPKATNENVYDEAYRESVEEILEERGPSPVIFSNNMVEHKK